MAKEEHNNNFALIALVAIVAVVGLVGLVMMQGTNNKVPTYIQTANAEDGNLAGDARMIEKYCQHSEGCWAPCDRIYEVGVCEGMQETK